MATIQQILSYIVGSSFFIFIITSIYNDVIRIPHLEVTEPTSMQSHYTTNITNSGITTATNLLITIKSTSSISNPVNISSTNNVSTSSKTNLTAGLFQISLPRLPPGDGSTLSITTLFKPLNIYVTYDQGSASRPSGNQNWIKNNLLLLYVVLTIAGVSIFTIPLLYRELNKRLPVLTCNFLIKLAFDMQEIIDILSTNLCSQELFWSYKPKSGNIQGGKYRQLYLGFDG